MPAVCSRVIFNESPPNRLPNASCFCLCEVQLCSGAVKEFANWLVDLRAALFLSLSLLRSVWCFLAEFSAAALPLSDAVMRCLSSRDWLARCPSNRAGLEGLRLRLLGNEHRWSGGPAALAALCEGGHSGDFEAVLKTNAWLLETWQDSPSAQCFGGALIKWAKWTKESFTASSVVWTNYRFHRLII